MWILLNIMSYNEVLHVILYLFNSSKDALKKDMSSTLFYIYNKNCLKQRIILSYIYVYIWLLYFARVKHFYIYQYYTSRESCSCLRAVNVVVWQLDLQLSMQSVPITTKVVNSNSAQARCTQYNISSWSVTSGRSVVFSGDSGFLHQ